MTMDISGMSASEIDLYHRKKRKRNMNLFSTVLYILIFCFVVSLGHSLVTQREVMVYQKQVDNLTHIIVELTKENEFLREKVD